MLAACCLAALQAVGEPEPSLCQKIGQHVAMHVRQPALDAVVVERQPLWSMPSRCRTVAWKSCTSTGFSAAFQPMSSVVP